MTNEHINIAIADASGLSWVDYCNDLNAMHEVESTLDVILGRLKFPEILAQVASRHEGFRSNGLPLPEWHRTHATARQRAEAFLRTIGKWKE